MIGAIWMLALSVSSSKRFMLPNMAVCSTFRPMPSLLPEPISFIRLRRTAEDGSGVEMIVIYQKGMKNIYVTLRVDQVIMRARTAWLSNGIMVLLIGLGCELVTLGATLGRGRLHR